MDASPTSAASWLSYKKLALPLCLLSGGAAAASSCSWAASVDAISRLKSQAGGGDEDCLGEFAPEFASIPHASQQLQGLTSAG